MLAITVKELRSRLPSCYYQFQKLFEPKTAAELLMHSPYDHAIDLLPRTAPPWGPVYSLSETELTALREYLEMMLASRKIRPSMFSTGTLILFVPKPYGRGLRLCVNYQGLNKITVKNYYLLLLMDKLRD